MDDETKQLLEKTRAELLAIVLTGNGSTDGFKRDVVTTLLGRSFWDTYVDMVFRHNTIYMSRNERAQIVLDALNRVHPPGE